MYTIKETAQILGLSEQHTRLKVNLGQIQAEKRGRDWFINETEMERLRGVYGKSNK
jgi:excisionase family DNA binding protein